MPNSDFVWIFYKLKKKRLPSRWSVYHTQTTSSCSCY